jgi:hypothetical protein
MPKKTHFEQIPLEVVKKIVEEEAKREETTESGRGTRKKELEPLEQLLLAAKQGQCEKRKAACADLNQRQPLVCHGGDASQAGLGRKTEFSGLGLHRMCTGVQPFRAAH